MSYLVNPSFEDPKGIAPWDRINIPSAVTYDIVQATAQVPAKSGGFYLSMKSTTPGGSIAQDFTVQGVKSITVLAWVRGKIVPVFGTLAIWQLGPPDRNVSANFLAGTADWTLVTAALDLTNVAANKTVRVEFYLGMPGVDLLVDSVNAF